MSAYLIDRIHFLSSDDSLFLQMCDAMTFVVQRAIVYEYLVSVSPDRADKNKIPFTKHGFSMMKEKVFPCYYSEAEQDVTFCQSNPLLTLGESFGIGSEEVSQQLRKHYEALKSLGE